MRYRHVLRRLARTPGFTAITIVTLALGIGANSAIFSVIEGVLLKPLPYPHAEQLIGLWHTAPAIHFETLNMGPWLYFTYREQNHTMQDVGLWDSSQDGVTGNARSGTGGQPAGHGRHSAAARRSADPGPRFSRPETSQEKSPDTVLLTFDYWQSHFSGNPSAVGQNMIVNDRPRQVIGVLPKGFRFLDINCPFVRPLKFDRAALRLGNFSYQGIARLKPGITMQQASADVARMIPLSFTMFPPPAGYSLSMFMQAGLAPKLQPLMHDVVGDIGATLWILMGTIGIVLLIACANVANLLLVRADGRQQELAVRAALGASWGRSRAN